MNDRAIIGWRGLVALAAATLAVGGGLWWQATHGLWNSHLVVDPVVYWQRATFFLEQGTWAGMSVNEYQPGALWFFAAVGVLAGGPGEFDPFLRALMAINVGLLALQVALARWQGPRGAAWVMLLCAALTGPLLLYRFELLVSLLVLSAWLWWRARRLVPAAVLLGVATATKIYPVLFVPLLLVAAWRAGRWRATCGVVAGYVCGGVLALAALGLGGARWGDVVAALHFHFDKPFGIEGLLGSGIPLVQALLGIPLRMAPRNGIYGFESDLGALPTWLLEWCWLVAVAVVMWLAWSRRSGRDWPEAGVVFALFGWYVVLGKLMAPQYLWWVVPFLAFVPPGWFRRGEWLAVAGLTAASLVLGQIIYPVNYSEFLECFKGDYTSHRLYWLNLVKNLSWLGAVAVATVALVRHAKRSPGGS